MKLNLEFDKSNDKYSDGDIEEEILKYAENYNESNIEEVFQNDIRWPVFYHLTNIRKNIINWKKKKKNSSVLEIGGGMGAITSTLCEKADRVVCVELSKRRASTIAARNKDRENLEIIVGNLNDIEFNEKFDYITLIGVFEYANLYTHLQYYLLLSCFYLRNYRDFLYKIGEFYN